MRGLLHAIVFFGCVIASFLLAVMSVRNSESPDIAVYPAAAQDFGTIRQQSETTVNFELRNQSDRPIEIVSIGTSCGCTQADAQTRTLAPAAATVLPLVYSSDSSRGQVTANAIVAYRVGNAEKVRTVTLSASGTIDPEYEVEPEVIEFSQPEQLQHLITLTPRHVPQLHVVSVAADKAFLDATLSTSHSNTGSVVVKVTLRPNDYYPEAGQPHVLVRTDCAKQPLLRVPVRIDPSVF